MKHEGQSHKRVRMKAHGRLSVLCLFCSLLFSMLVNACQCLSVLVNAVFALCVTWWGDVGVKVLHAGAGMTDSHAGAGMTGQACGTGAINIESWARTIATLVVLGLGAGSNVQLQPQQRSLSERQRLDTSNTCAGCSWSIGCGLMCAD
jgi:hypothetical protein